MSFETRILEPGDEAMLEEFLVPLTESSMFLRSNARCAGLIDRGETLQGTYVAAIESTPCPRMVAVVSHCWNGMVLLQVPEALPNPPDVMQKLLRHLAQSERPIHGLAAPWQQACAARRILGLEDAPTSLDSCEDLFSLQLAELRVPPALAAGEVRCRQPHESELELLAQWHVDYCEEALGTPRSERSLQECRREMQRLQRDRLHFLLVRPTADGDSPLSYCAYNSQLPECVQIGGVWTPPQLRGCGYARAVVAGSLLAAREGGVAQSILFTGDENIAAQRAYLGIGYQIVGDYGLILFRDPKPYSELGERG